MSALAAIYSRVSSRLTDKPGSRLFTRAHAWLVTRSGGRLRHFLGADVLVLRTTGRRSGQPREAVAIYVRDGDAYVVVPSNAASKKTPAWWHNLRAEPNAEVLVEGAWQPVRAREATDSERERLWPRLVAAYSGYEHYRRVAGRELTVVMLEPR